MPKGLIVIARLNVGGTAHYIAELSKGLIASGYEVQVATGYVQGAEKEDAVVVTLPIRRISSLGRKISLIADFRAWRELKRVIAEFEPDLIYSHTFKAGLLTRLIKSDAPKIHAFHGHLLSEPELAGWKSRVVVWIERWLAPRARVLVTVGKKVAQELLAEGVGKAAQYRSIAPGVHPLHLEDELVVRRELGLSEERRPIVIWLARVTAVKAPQRVIEVARRVPSALFLLAGGGDLLAEMKRAESENLRVLGWHDAKKIWAIADLAISTSENEGMPVALIEAQLAGVPVVGIDVGSVAEVVADGETGFVLSEFGDCYIEKVEELVGNQALRVEMGRAAKARALREFSPSQMVNSHLSLFAEILSR